MRRVVFLSILLIVCGAAWANDIKVVEIPGATNRDPQGGYLRGRFVASLPLSASWAIGDSGMIASINATTSEALLYPDLSSSGSFARAIHQGIGAGPVSIVYKRFKNVGYFLIACAGDNSIYVLNEKDGSIAKTIVLKRENLTSVAAPVRSDIEFAYYTAGQNSTGVIGRISLATFNDEGLVEIPDHETFEIAPSPDGNILYARRRGTSPMGFMAYQILPPDAPGGPMRASQMIYEHETRSPYYPDPAGQFVACGKQIYSTDLMKVLGELPATVLAYSQKHPLMFATDGANILALSTNTRKVLGQVSLPVASGPIKRRSNPSNDEQTRFLVDDAHNCVVICTDSTVAIIPMDEFKMKFEPFLAVEMRGDLNLSVGVPWSANLLKRDPATKIELANPPAGLGLAGDELMWTPRSPNVGNVEVSLKLSNGGVERTQVLTLQVRRAGVQLPFIPDLVNVSPDGKIALIARLGNESQARVRRGRAENDSEVGPRVAVVDLVKLMVVADRSLSSPIHNAVVDENFAYIALRDSDALVVLSVKDLSDAKRIFTDGRPWNLESTGERLYVGLSNKPTVWFKTPALEPGMAPSPVTMISQPSPLPVKIGDGWYDQGVVYNGNFKQARMIVQDDTFAPITQAFDRFRGGYDTSDLPPAPWDVRLNGGTIQRSTGQTIAQIEMREATSPVHLNDIPAVAVLHFPGANHHATGDRDRSEVVLHDLVTGGELEPVALMDELQRPHPGPGGDSRALLASNGVLVAQVRQQLFVLRISDFNLANLPQPLQIQPPVDSLAIPGSERTTLNYKTEGGKGPFEFSLAIESPGIQIDKTTGALTVDPKVPLQESVDRVLQFVQSRYTNNPATNGQRTPEEAVQAYREISGRRFVRLVGKQPGGIPVAIAITINVRDSEQQSARLTQLLLVDAPAEFLSERMAEIKQKTANQQALRQTQQAQNQAMLNSSAGVIQLRQRINELENENRQLRAKVDALTDVLVRDQGRGTTTRP